jgi:FG-GAP repeat
MQRFLPLHGPALLVALLAPAARAQDLVPVHQAELLAADGMPFDELGRSVALDGDTALVGAPTDDGAAQDSGSAYVFVRSSTSWSQEAKLVPLDPDLEDEFGSAVALSGDTAAFGVANADDAGASSGAAYVFTRSGTTWTQEAKIVPADSAAGDAFGTSIALSGDTLAVGAPSDDDAGMSSGAVYVFTRSGTTWSQQAKLVPAGLGAIDFLGTAVALEGDTLLAGAPFDDDAALNAGAVYVLARAGTTWTQQAKLVAPDAAASDFLGSALALRGDRAIAGAGGADPAGDASGAAYVFQRAGTAWSEDAKLTAPDGAAGDTFGQAVEIEGDVALAGANERDMPDPNRGAVYVFQRDATAWTLRALVGPANGHAGQRFGHSLAIDAGTFVAGTSPDVHAGLDPGSAGVFTLEPALRSFCDAGPCPCGNEGLTGRGCENARGTGGVRLDVAAYAPDAFGGGTADLVGTGFPSPGTPTVVIVRGVGFAPAPLALGDGLLCIDPAGLVRLRADTASGGTLTHALTHRAGAGTFDYQLWYRSEPASYCSPDAFNLSNGASIAWP